MTFRLAVGFAFFAGISRLLLPLTLSRIQIVAFVLAAMLIEAVAKPIAGKRPSAGSFLSNACAATVAIVLVKWWLEGVSLAHWARVAAFFLRRLT